MKEQKCSRCGTVLLGYADFERYCSKCDNLESEAIREQEAKCEEAMFCSRQ